MCLSFRSDVLQRRVCPTFSLLTSQLTALFPAELPVISVPLMGRQCKVEARGIMAETAGALVTASLLSKPAQWQSGNFPLNYRKKRCRLPHVITETCTSYVCDVLCERKSVHQTPTRTRKHTATRNDLLSVLIEAGYRHTVERSGMSRARLRVKRLFPVVGVTLVTTRRNMVYKVHHKYSRGTKMTHYAQTMQHVITHMTKQTKQRSRTIICPVDLALPPFILAGDNTSLLNFLFVAY